MKEKVVRMNHFFFDIMQFVKISPNYYWIYNIDEKEKSSKLLDPSHKTELKEIYVSLRCIDYIHFISSLQSNSCTKSG